MGNRRPVGVAVVVVSAGVQLCGAGFGCEVVQQRVPRAVGGDRGGWGRRSRGEKERRKAIVEVDEEYNFVDSEVFYYFTTTSLE